MNRSSAKVQFPFMLFDWGDTIMKDDPGSQVPMYQWPEVETVEGVEDVLRELHFQRTIGLATSAELSDEEDIRSALQRVRLASYFQRIYCFKNTGKRKPSEGFFRHILLDLNAKTSDVLMVGDSFEKDVLGANRVGIRAIWLNSGNTDQRVGKLHKTIHSLHDLVRIVSSTW